MVCCRLIFVISTISFIARTAVATDRRLKSSKSEKSEKQNKDTDFPTTFSPTFFPTFFPTEDTANPTKSPIRDPTRNPTKSPTAFPTKTPTKNPTKAPTASPTKPPTKTPTITPSKEPSFNPSSSPAPTDSPTGSPDFKKLSLQDKVNPIDAIALFDEVVNGKIVTFTDVDGRCGEIVCAAKVSDISCVRTKNQFELFPNSNGEITRAKGLNVFTTTQNLFAAKKDCCNNPTCVTTYIETEAFAVSSSSKTVLFQIEPDTFLIVGPFRSWIEAAVALYDESNDALVQSFVFRGEDDVAKLSEKFTGVEDGTYYLRFFPAAYDFYTKNELKYNFKIKNFEYAVV